MVLLNIARTHSPARHLVPIPPVNRNLTQIWGCYKIVRLEK
jgi:hypothetical protein